jgi:electron transfer flavoprotein alpha/beta subunit
VKVERQTESGYDEVTAPLPALVTVTAGVVEPRYASFKGIMAAKSKPLEILSVADLSLGDQTGTSRRATRDHGRRRRRVARGRREVRRRG